MAVFTILSHRVARPAVLLLAVALVGCRRSEPTPEPEPPPPAPAPAVQNAAPKPPPLDPRLHQSFAEATRADPPADWPRPPDTTLTGKSVGKLYTEVKALWDRIRFVNAEGKPLAYRAILDTELGEIEIAFRPDLAPNHVRNFVALARAGYYDGLVFERTVHEQTGDNPADALCVIEGGCPLGSGEIGLGSIGYWLKPECSKEATHEPGTVGACRGEELDSAACRFYITLNKAPLLDGHYTVFGKVTRGLEVARKIFEQPVRQDDQYPEGDRPLKPVVIRRVTILCSEVDNSGASAENK
ncbi:MAG TPA: peptidylprolyl isomerase [Gemmataceae bacterium]|nr:peptidylprolyl isomerase [Gemmataceae bacterium]